MDKCFLLGNSISDVDRFYNFLSVSSNNDLNIFSKIHDGIIIPEQLSSSKTMDIDDLKQVRYGYLFKKDVKIHHQKESDFAFCDERYSLLKESSWHNIKDYKFASMFRIFSENSAILNEIVIGNQTIEDKEAYSFGEGLFIFTHSENILIPNFNRYINPYMFSIFRINFENEKNEIITHYRMEPRIYNTKPIEFTLTGFLNENDSIWTEISKRASLLLEKEIDITNIDELQYYINMYRLIGY